MKRIPQPCALVNADQTSYHESIRKALKYFESAPDGARAVLKTNEQEYIVSKIDGKVFKVPA